MHSTLHTVGLCIQKILNKESVSVDTLPSNRYIVIANSDRKNDLVLASFPTLHDAINAVNRYKITITDSFYLIERASNR